MASPARSPRATSSRRRARTHSSVLGFNSSTMAVDGARTSSSSLTSEIALRDARLSSLNPLVASCEAQMASQDSQISFFASRISALQSHVAYNDAGISAMESQLGSLDPRTPMSDAGMRRLCAARGEDHFGRLPVEIRLMIYKELLIAPLPIFRGAEQFGKLRKAEYNPEMRVVLSTGILSTCRRYYYEAVSILYTRNRMMFCTGYDGSSGWFARFPISRQYMPFLMDIGVYFRVTDADATASSRVGHFLKALGRRAPNLRHLLVCAASDRYYEAVCPRDIMFYGPQHPVVSAILSIIARKNVQHIKLRVHDDAAYAPYVPNRIKSVFENHNPKPGATLTFSRSCSSPDDCPIHAKEGCQVCGKRRASDNIENWPIDDIALSCDWCEPDRERLEELIDELEEKRCRHNDDEDDYEDNDHCFNCNCLEQDSYDPEDRRDSFETVLYGYVPQFGKVKWSSNAFTLDNVEHPHCFNCEPVLCERQYRITDMLGYLSIKPKRCVWCGDNSWELSKGRYRGEITRPAVWRMRQSKITKFFKIIAYEEYFKKLFPSSYNNIPTDSSHGVGHLKNPLDVMPLITEHEIEWDMDTFVKASDGTAF
ncbi:hypothetical protein BU16DRAFT_266113 [Lophium mytilinum]|uniref:Uncharacterized protein n=1 Tax=Lophium mytilinum TaxID=390894 RepID=A0A6A6R3G7_9PEZI|nr:hypothetical protein BU16DRAFT_266113 [Lophium mytilinum]